MTDDERRLRRTRIAALVLAIAGIVLLQGGVVVVQGGWTVGLLAAVTLTFVAATWLLARAHRRRYAFAWSLFGLANVFGFIAAGAILRHLSWRRAGSPQT